MLKFFKVLVMSFIALLPSPILLADGVNPDGRISISGYVKDAENGEALIGATVAVKELKSGTATNLYGFFSLSLKPGSYVIEFSYVGYAPVFQKVTLSKNTSITVELLPEQKQLEEVVVTADRPDANVKKAEMSVAKLEMKTIRQVPALMGEVDVIKVIQMLPGVLPTAEGTSGFSVRGGGMDHNLILIDEATVYNASHLMGFFSVFNNDAIRDVKLYKGDIPANYGGRLSSVLDVRMKEGNSKKFSITGGVGLISSRLTMEGPIGSEKTSFLISGRRTYADMFFPLLTDSGVRKSKMYFYDLNLKINHQINNNNRLYLSAYTGRDKFGQKGSSDAGFGNMTGTLRWNHLFSERLFSNLTTVVAKYDYSLKMSLGGSNYVWNSKMVDYSVKMDFNYFLNPENELKFGLASTLHDFDPCDAYMEGERSRIGSPVAKNYALEHGIYLSNQQKIGENLIVKYGVRYTLFQNIGPATLYNFSKEDPDNYRVTDTIYYTKRKIFNTYHGFEPRIGFTYTISQKSSVKASYSRTVQYMQLASNSNGGMPLDVWFPSSPNVKPQKADQFAVGYFRNFENNKYETSIEAYYKNMYDVVDFKDNAQLLMNPRLEGEIRSGTGRAYGIEFLIRKNEGRFNGWISYTLSKVTRKIPEINNGKEYSAPYDKPNNINVILNYQFSEHIILSGNWVYATGAPITFPVGSYFINNTYGKYYSTRNGYRMRDYHRLDLSLTLKGKLIPGRMWQGEWVFSIYNVYGRHNDWMINFTQDSKNAGKIVAERWYLPFVYFPGITYNFKF
jgi:outer membrane cobalamin receptor